MVLKTEAIIRSQESVAVQVSVTSPPQASGVALKVEELEFPLIKHSPLKPLLKAILLEVGIAPQFTVMLSSAVIVGKAAGFTVMVLETEAIIRSQESVAVQVSVTSPPQVSGVALKVEALESPVIKQSPLKPLLNIIVLEVGIAPQFTVMLSSAVIVGKAAGFTVMVLKTEAIIRSQESVAVQVSVTSPPQASGVVLKVEALESPVIKQSPLKPLLNIIVLEVGIAPQLTAILSGAIIVGKAAGFIVIVLVLVIVLSKLSVKVQVSIISPPQLLFGFWRPRVEVTEPLIKQLPVSPLL
jgi:hypothetical protein